jgi:RNA polymerase subunit RPABC4/transcription elongation factor Spt4
VIIINKSLGGGLMICTKCNSEIKPGKKFCGICGTPAVVPERRCGACNTKLDEGENFCPDCGAKYGENTIIVGTKPTKTEAKKPIFETNSLISSDCRTTLRIKKGISEEEKATIKKLKKSNEFFLYDKEKNVIYTKRDDLYIEAYFPNNLQTPIIKYTISETINKLISFKILNRPMYYFYSNQDAFFAWDDYIFISVYKGQIKWSAADTRDERHLPNQKADCSICYPGQPELEFLPNGNIKSMSFYDNIECKIEQGMFVPIK